jgi:spore coat protein U-like protein
MRSMFKSVLTVAGFGLASAFMSGGQAEALSTATALLDVTVDVTQTCTWGADQALDFGTYTTAGGTVSGSATFSLNCTAGSLLEVALNDGSNALPSSTAADPDRAMANGAATLEYELCQDAGCTAVWGSSAGVNTLPFSGNGAGQNVTVFGQIAGGQPVVSGTYADQVSISVDF